MLIDFVLLLNHKKMVDFSFCLLDRHFAMLGVMAMAAVTVKSLTIN